MVNMLRHYRNNPCVVMWSIGNEVPTQCRPDGYRVAEFLQDICHREDPTRPVTCGMDQIDCVLSNGFASVIDIPGFNYRTHRYEDGYRILPQNLLLGSETASTVSSRGVYKFPVEDKNGATYEDHQSSSYDVEAGDGAICPTSTSPLPKIIHGLSVSLCGPGSTIWANRSPTTPTHGPTTVPCSA